MKSRTHDESTSVVEVTHIDGRSLWLYVDGREYCLPFDVFPWFAEATVRQIANVERHGRDRLHWPDLDVDLNLDRLEHPEKYPLKFRP